MLQENAMLTAFLITALIIASLALGLHSERRGRMIPHHPYNNRYNDASGAREDHPEL